ncbi:MAG TPA: hypothetical protein VMB47_19960 [Candidatus Aquilonibacter sp.]|nr:hypothetical protein [Candidatus Aquilonibacter sp.]
MHEKKHVHQRERAVDGEHIPPDNVPYWRRAHRDWRLWVGLFFMLAAIAIYVFTVDLSVVPGNHPQQPAPNAAQK